MENGSGDNTLFLHKEESRLTKVSGTSNRESAYYVKS